MVPGSAESFSLACVADFTFGKGNKVGATGWWGDAFPLEAAGFDRPVVLDMDVELEFDFNHSFLDVFKLVFVFVLRNSPREVCRKTQVSKSCWLIIRRMCGKYYFTNITIFFINLL